MQIEYEFDRLLRPVSYKRFSNLAKRTTSRNVFGYRVRQFLKWIVRVRAVEESKTLIDDSSCEGLGTLEPRLRGILDQICIRSQSSEFQTCNVLITILQQTL